MSDNEPAPNNERIVTRTYSGPNRRENGRLRGDSRSKRMRRSEGNRNREAVAASAPKRQEFDEETVNLLKILKIDGPMS